MEKWLPKSDGVTNREIISQGAKTSVYVVPILETGDTPTSRKVNFNYSCHIHQNEVTV